MEQQPHKAVQGMIVEDPDSGERTIGGFTFEELRHMGPCDAAERLVRNVGSGKERESGIILAMQEVFSGFSHELVRRYVIEARDYVIDNE